MTNRATFTLDDDVFDFLKAKAGRNRSAYINAPIRKERQLPLTEAIRKANEEEANDTAYQEELSHWDITLSDGLTTPMTSKDFQLTLKSRGRS